MRDQNIYQPRYCVQTTQCFFRFRGPKSDRFFGVTQANFEANSADFHQLTHNFGNFKQKPCNNRLTEPNSSKNLANIA